LYYTGKETLVTHRTYLLAQRHRSSNHATHAKLRDSPGWKTISRNCGHDVMIDDPEGLTMLLLEELQR